VIATPTWLTGAQAREHLKLSKGTFLKLVKDGRITQFTIPGLRDPRYKLEELDALFVAVPKEEVESDSD
jgi:hypothetical protein